MADILASEHIPESLREALRLSPGNVPLLAHAAEVVLQKGHAATAEGLFKHCLSLQPHLKSARLGLAQAFAKQEKFSAAMVIVEDMLAKPDAPAEAFLLHAHLALHAGERALAAREYERAREKNAALRDEHLERSLGNYLKPSQNQPKANDEATADSFADAVEAFDEKALTPASAPELEEPGIRFEDVGGMERIKEEIRLKIILPAKQPQLFKAYGKKAGGGILLYGPPGCGKTFLARATAGEVGAHFISVGINDVLDMWMGQSERNLHSLFEQARANRPCVLFFDEVDALGANRADLLKSNGRQIINQFLAELDGVNVSNEGILILAATNAPWHLDAAFRRPGRFDRILFVPPPDLAARRTILRLHLRGKPVAPIDFDVVAKRTEGFSGADLKAIVDLAVESRLEDALRSGLVETITERDLLEAVKRHKPTVRDWFETARNYALYANQSGLYDEIRSYLKMDR